MGTFGDSTRMEDALSNIVTQEKIDDYVAGALQYPLRNIEQLVWMTLLHFPDAGVVDIRSKVSLSLLKLAVKGIGK